MKDDLTIQKNTNMPMLLKKLKSLIIPLFFTSNVYPKDYLRIALALREIIVVKNLEVNWKVQKNPCVFVNNYDDNVHEMNIACLLPFYGSYYYLSFVLVTFIFMQAQI